MLLWGWARSCCSGGFGFCLGSTAGSYFSAISIRIRRLTGFLRRRSRSDDLGTLFARPEERSAGENADQFFHRLDSFLYSLSRGKAIFCAIPICEIQNDSQNGASYFKPCASATAAQVNRPSLVLIPPLSAGTFLQAFSNPRSASNST